MDKLRNRTLRGAIALGTIMWSLLGVLSVGGAYAVYQASDRPVHIYTSERVSITGDAVTQIPTTEYANRGSVGVRNEDATYSVWVKVVLNGATAPSTTTVDDTIFKLAPGESRVYDFDSRFDLYVMNSSGGATSSDIYVEQFQGGAAQANNSGSGSISGSVTVQEPLSVDDNGGSLTVDNGGTFATQATLQAGTNLIGKVANSPDTTTIYDGTTAATPKFAIIDHAVSGDNTIVAAVASKKIRVLSGLLIASAAVTVRFESGASGTALTGQMQLAANAGFQIPYCAVGNFQTATNTLLNLELSGATSVDGWIVYVEVN